MKTTTEMQLVPIQKLVPYINNARTHSPEQIGKLRASLREFGFINPVIIDRDYGVIAGHGRILAAKEEGIKEVPCVFADHLTEAQKKAYIIADNRMAMDAGWDEELLRVEIEALQGMDFDPLLTGFDEKELAALFDDGAEAKDDDFDVDEELEKPVFSKTGDVWTLGRHRLVCGDSIKAETYEILMQGKKANLVVTDPPYNVNYEGSAGKIKNDNMAAEKFYQFLLDAFHAGTHVVITGNSHRPVLMHDVGKSRHRSSFSCPDSLVLQLDVLLVIKIWESLVSVEGCLVRSCHLPDHHRNHAFFTFLNGEVRAGLASLKQQFPAF